MAMELKRQKICPVCGKENETEFTSCENCGATLIEQFEQPDTTRRMDEKVELPKNLESLLATMVPTTEGVALYFSGDFEPFATVKEDEFILGRIVEGMKVGEREKIVDLSPYSAFEMGISRRHAMVRRTKTGYEICDLGSTNGTWVNGLRLIPYKTYPFNKAQVRIGQMRLFVVYREFNK
jgi:hypothetical protein